LIGVQTASHPGTGKDPRMGAEQGQIRVAGKRGLLAGQTCAHHQIVCVHPRNQRAAAFGGSGVKRTDQTARFG